MENIQDNKTENPSNLIKITFHWCHNWIEFQGIEPLYDMCSKHSKYFSICVYNCKLFVEYFYESLNIYI